MVGVIVLYSTDGIMLIHLSGALFMALTFLSLKKGNPKNVNLSNYAYLGVGSLIGFLTGAISVSGPPLALFLNRANVGNRKFREIFAWFSVITATIAILGYFQAGLLTLQTIKTSLLFVPILLTGTIVGKKLNTIMSIGHFQIINIVLTLISSFLLLFS
jgi:hypothetical protein